MMVPEWNFALAGILFAFSLLAAGALAATGHVARRNLKDAGRLFEASVRVSSRLKDRMDLELNSYKERNDDLWRRVIGCDEHSASTVRLNPGIAGAASASVCLSMESACIQGTASDACFSYGGERAELVVDIALESLPEGVDWHSAWKLGDFLVDFAGICSFEADLDNHHNFGIIKIRLSSKSWTYDGDVEAWRA